MKPNPHHVMRYSSYKSKKINSHENIFTFIYQVKIRGAGALASFLADPCNEGG